MQSTTESLRTIDITGLLRRGPIAVCNPEIAAVLGCISDNVFNRALLICEIYEARGIKLKVKFQFQQTTHEDAETKPAAVILTSESEPNPWTMEISSDVYGNVKQAVNAPKRKFKWNH
ncbi:MAG: hypothetical protein US89_C0014G0006 [Candidatus Peregrinibacteria bacterium GW2011_GWF2_38_29]|nr:MAG: hypothetical protein US89_C0014G0006 [Candidatus Peregrinibacteria bacterium GW2011_GWF2_38_29]HBB02586.1 hypothetical protein [Candidatus Peregrinibacteria bacterium]